MMRLNHRADPGRRAAAQGADLIERAAERRGEPHDLVGLGLGHVALGEHDGDAVADDQRGELGGQQPRVAKRAGRAAQRLGEPVGLERVGEQELVERDRQASRRPTQVRLTLRFCR